MVSFHVHIASPRCWLPQSKGRVLFTSELSTSAWCGQKQVPENVFSVNEKGQRMTYQWDAASSGLDHIPPSHLPSLQRQHQACLAVSVFRPVSGTAGWSQLHTALPVPQTWTQPAPLRDQPPEMPRQAVQASETCHCSWSPDGIAGPVQPPVGDGWLVE